jgi:hypothetical protein
MAPLIRQWALTVRTLPEPDRHRAARWLHRLRQVVETGFGKLAEVFSLKLPRSSSAAYAQVRTAAILRAPH